LRAVRRELVAVYWASKGGLMDPAKGSKLTFMLVQIAGLITTGEIEPRMAELEARFATQGRE